MLCEREKGQKHGGDTGQSSKQSIMESCSESHSASVLSHPSKLFFYIGKTENWRKRCFCWVFAFQTSCNLDRSKLICGVNQGKMVYRKALCSQVHVPWREEGTEEGHERGQDRNCFSGSFSWFLSTSDCGPQRRRGEVTPPPHPAAPAVPGSKVQVAGGRWSKSVTDGRPTFPTTWGLWKVRRVWWWDSWIIV